jgi:hypothetical protein
MEVKTLQNYLNVPIHSKGLPTVTRVQWWAPWFGKCRDEKSKQQTKQGVCHIVALPFTLKRVS